MPLEALEAVSATQSFPEKLTVLRKEKIGRWPPRVVVLVKDQSKTGRNMERKSEKAKTRQVVKEQCPRNIYCTRPARHPGWCKVITPDKTNARPRRAKMKKKKSVGRPKSEVRSSSASTYCSNGSADSMVEGQESVEEEAAEGSAEGNGMIDSTVRTVSPERTYVRPKRFLSEGEKAVFHSKAKNDPPERFSVLSCLRNKHCIRGPCHPGWCKIVDPTSPRQKPPKKRRKISFKKIKPSGLTRNVSDNIGSQGKGEIGIRRRVGMVLGEIGSAPMKKPKQYRPKGSSAGLLDDFEAKSSETNRQLGNFSQESQTATWEPSPSQTYIPRWKYKRAPRINRPRLMGPDRDSEEQIRAWKSDMYHLTKAIQKRQFQLNPATVRAVLTRFIKGFGQPIQGFAPTVIHSLLFSPAVSRLVGYIIQNNPDVGKGNGLPVDPKNFSLSERLSDVALLMDADRIIHTLQMFKVVDDGILQPLNHFLWRLNVNSERIADLFESMELRVRETYLTDMEPSSSPVRDSQNFLFNHQDDLLKTLDLAWNRTIMSLRSKLKLSPNIMTTKIESERKKFGREFQQAEKLIECLGINKRDISVLTTLKNYILTLLEPISIIAKLFDCYLDAILKLEPTETKKSRVPAKAEVPHKHHTRRASATRYREEAGSVPLTEDTINEIAKRMEACHVPLSRLRALFPSGSQTQSRRTSSECGQAR
ncbi:hypothetical protein AAMO2058_000974800 [Amorphochlora amoebiformis]